MVDIDPVRGVRAILLDFDGTLVSSLDALKAVYLRFLALYNVQGSDAEFEELNGPSLAEIVQLLRERYQLGSDVSELLITYRRLLDQIYGENLVACDGANDLLLALKQRGYLLALVTSAPRTLVDKILAQLGWTEYFCRLLTGDLVKSSKPSGDIYFKALESLGLERSSLLAVEDSANGIRAARAAGISVIGLSADSAANFVELGALMQLPDLFAVRHLLCAGDN